MRRLGTREIAIVGIFVCVLALAVWLVVHCGKEKGVAQEETSGVSTDQIAEGEHPDVDSSKSDGYKKNDGFSIRNNYDDLWADMQEEIETGSEPAEDVRDARTRNEEKALQALLGDQPEETVQRATPPPIRRSSGGGSSSRPRTQQEKDDKVRHDYELAAEIVQKMYGDQMATPTAEGSASGQETSAQRVEIPSSNVRARTSSMDDWGGTLSSLDEQGGVFSGEELRPFKCMFVREEKIRNGQRVTLRLLEDVVMDGTVIPSNSHLTAVCNLKDRLYISVTSFEMNGRIHSLDLSGYDTDGALGIYCPDMGSDTAKTIRDDAINIGQSAVRGSIGTVASSVLRTGASIIRSSSGSNPSVTVPSGYTIYLMKNTRR